jgi:origin recognition complex subunit 4
LIASKQLRNRDREVFNFEMCFDELKRFISKIEMDRLGATSVGTPDGSGKRRIGGPLAATFGLGWQGLADRRRVMMAFRSLLQLELFQPEASLNTLSMGLTSSAPAGQQRAGQAVRTEFLRVKCTIFPQDIILAAKAKNRQEALGIHLVQWATSQG